MKDFDISQYPIIFDTPRKLEGQYPWVGHIPFAFFLVSVLKPGLFVELGVNTGNSYNAFCQAVKLLQTKTACYGVDTWKGDEHTEPYGEDVYQKLFRYHQQEYQEFSYLLRMTFDEALQYFSDSSIDLLHIDGYHTYEAVKHDFESWLPKMNEKGVMLLHDTQVRERNFGVWKLWEEISHQYCSLEFTHSYGLGVLILNQDVNSEIVSFFHAWQQNTFYNNLFARLGSYISLLGAIKDI